MIYWPDIPIWCISKLMILISYIYLIFRFFILLILTPIVFLLSAITLFAYSNCWIYAISNYVKIGGHVIFRRTQWSKYKVLAWEHAVWSLNLKDYYEYVPMTEKKTKIIPPLLFKGHVIKLNCI